MAGLAVQELGLQQSASSFLSYVHCRVRHRPAADRHSQCTVSPIRLCFEQMPWPAPSSSSGQTELQDQQNLVLQSLDQQINQAKQRVNSIDAQISQLSSQPTSPTQQSQLSKLRAEQTNATATLASLQASRHRQPDDHPAGPDGGVEGQPDPERRPASSLAAEAPDHLRCSSDS